MECVLFIDKYKQQNTKFDITTHMFVSLIEDMKAHITANNIPVGADFDEGNDDLEVFRLDAFKAGTYDYVFHVTYSCEPFFRGSYLCLSQKRQITHEPTMYKDFDEVNTYEEFLERILRCLDRQVL